MSRPKRYAASANGGPGPIGLALPLGGVWKSTDWWPCVLPNPMILLCGIKYVSVSSKIIQPAQFTCCPTALAVERPMTPASKPSAHRLSRCPLVGADPDTRVGLWDDTNASIPEGVVAK